MKRKNAKPTRAKRGDSKPQPYQCACGHTAPSAYAHKMHKGLCDAVR